MTNTLHFPPGTDIHNLEEKQFLGCESASNDGPQPTATKCMTLLANS
jgi:hypothetical protein